MPTYQYVCKQCGHQLEELQSFKEPPLVKCPSCNHDALARVMGVGSGLIFKGSGFYLTDYVKNNDKKSSSSSEKKDKSESDSSAATPAAKPEPSPSKPPSSPSDSKKE